MPWLKAEIQIIGPEVLVCLGATAAQALLGRDFRITKQRGRLLASDLAPHVLATGHPAAILRAPDPSERDQGKQAPIADLRKVAKVLSGV